MCVHLWVCVWGRVRESSVNSEGHTMQKERERDRKREGPTCIKETGSAWEKACCCFSVDIGSKQHHKKWVLFTDSFSSTDSQTTSPLDYIFSEITTIFLFSIHHVSSNRSNMGIVEHWTRNETSMNTDKTVLKQSWTNSNLRYPFKRIKGHLLRIISPKKIHIFCCKKISSVHITI